jgi:chromate reductase
MAGYQGGYFVGSLSSTKDAIATSDAVLFVTPEYKRSVPRNARQMTATEAYIHFRPEVFADDGSVSDDSTAGFLRDFLTEFRIHVESVLTVIPRGVTSRS